MILVDTSVWVEFLRGTDRPATDFVDERLGDGLACSEPIMLELLAGARPGAHAAKIERLLLAQSWCGIKADLDFRGAVDVFHATRATGHQPRSLQDCLIAAVVLRRDISLAHQDIDFERIAFATNLRTIDLR